MRVGDTTHQTIVSLIRTPWSLDSGKLQTFGIDLAALVRTGLEQILAWDAYGEASHATVESVHRRSLGQCSG